MAERCSAPADEQRFRFPADAEEVSEVSYNPVRRQSRRESRERIVHYDSHTKAERVTEGWMPPAPVVVGITAGASCPNNLIEDVIVRVFELHGISRDRL